MQQSSAPLPGCHFQFVTDNQEFNRLCETWSSLPFLTLDTEFIRTSTFYPKAGLLQISDGNDIYLVDPLHITDWVAFALIMKQESLTKVMHSCSEDMLVILALTGCAPTPVFDTQIAHAFLNKGFGISYQNLVADIIGHEIPKEETRSDWLQRPLTQKQLDYAALDVLYLPEIYSWQVKMLKSQGKLEWCLEDCKQLLNPLDTEISKDFSEYYLQLKGGWQLQGRNLMVLKQLAEWREQRARQRDKPRSWILPDKPMISIARECPGQLHELAAIEGVNDNFVKYEGNAVLAIILKALDHPEEPDIALIDKPLNSSEKKKIRKAQEFILNKALELDLPVEILARKKTLLNLMSLFRQETEEPLINHPALDDNALPAEFGGWRKALLVEPLMEIFQ